jgi:hypothetical protein
MNKLHQASRSGQRFIDYKIGIAGAIVMGSIVFGINYFSTGEITGSTTAALKQGTYTFFLGGSLMKGCEYLATAINKRIYAVSASILIPSLLTLILTYTMHTLKGTPKPLESTLPTLIIIPATIIWGIKKRMQKESDQISTQ